MKNGQTRERAPDPAPSRRAVERDYLAALADLVPLDTWREFAGRRSRPRRPATRRPSTGWPAT